MSKKFTTKIRKGEFYCKKDNKNIMTRVGINEARVCKGLFTNGLG